MTQLFNGYIYVFEVQLSNATGKNVAKPYQKWELQYGGLQTGNNGFGRSATWTSHLRLS